MQLKVLAFDNTTSQFNTTGASPWLRDQDYPTAYIDSSGRNTDQELFTFDAPEGAVAIINSVTLYVYGWQQNAGQMAVEINSGDTGLALPTGGVANRAWASVDVSGILTTWAQIAAAQLGFDRTNNTSNSGADAAYLLVDYDLILGSQNLAAGFTVRRPGSQEFLAGFDIQEPLSDGSEDLKGEFISRQPGSKILLGGFTAGLEVGSEELLAEFIVRQRGSQELAASFDGQVSRELLARFDIRRIAAEDLLSGIRWILGDWEIEMSADGSDAVRLSGPQRKIFKNPRGQGNWYCLVKYDTDEWKIQTSSDGRLWKWTGVTIPSRDSPSLWTWEDSGNSRLVIWIAKKWGPSGDRDQDIRVDCYQIPDASINPASLFTESVVQTKSIDIYYPCICRADDGYLWVVYTYGWDDGNLHRDIRCKCSTSINPVAGPTWSTEATVQPQGLVDDPDTISKALVIPVYATADVVFVYALDDEPITDALIGRKGTYAGAGAPSISGATSLDVAIHVNKNFSAVAAGPDSDVVVVYRDFGGSAWVARKYDISANTDSAFDRVDDTADWVEMSMGVVRQGNSDADLIVVVGTTNNTFKEIHAHFRRFNGSAAWSPRKELYQFQTTINQLPVNMIYEDVNGQLGIASVQEGTLTRVWFWYLNHTSEELSAKFVVRQAGSRDLGASFDGQVSLNLPAEFVSKQEESKDLPAKFSSGFDAGLVELLGEFISRQAGSQDLGASFDGQVSLNLPAKFVARRDGSQELLGEFDVRRDASQELLGKFDVRRDGSEELAAEFTVRQPGSQKLLGELIVRQPGSQDLPAEFVSRQAGSQDLGASFDGQVSLNLPAELTVRQPGSQELLAEFAVYFSGSADLPAEFVSRQAGSQDLPAEFIVQSLISDGSENLFGKLDIRHPASQGLSGKFEIRRDGSGELVAEFDVRHDGSQDLSGGFTVRESAAQNLPARFIVQAIQASSEELLSRFTVQPHGSTDLPCGFIVSNIVGSADLLGKLEIRNHMHSPQVKGIFTVNQVNASTELGAHFDVRYRRIFGENWQRKSWFTDPYYWRSYYSLALDSFIFEYIHKTGLTGNVWTENVNARISAAGFDAAALEADFSVRGPRNGLPITIVYSDGRDVWVAESDETSILGWDWQNLNKVFDAGPPDWYRRVGIFADRKTPTPGLYAVAVYYDDAPGGVQYVRFSEQSTPGDITGWDAAEDVSNTANTNKILGVAGRSMGATGATKKEVIVVYKEGAAIRSRYHTSIAGWAAIQDIDATAEAEKSLACFDIEHYETLAGNNMMHIIYVDADNTVWAAERNSGAAVAWGTFVNLDASATEHDNVGLVNIDSIQFYMWQEGHNIGYRIHRCDPETWWPALVNTYNEFDPSTEAVITTTSQPEQIQGPDDISAGDAVAINWIGLIAAAGRGWGILQPATSETLIGGFVVRRSASVDLAASFDGQVSLNFPAGFIVRQPASEELPAEFDSGQDWENLPVQLTVRHSASRELHAGFDGQVSLNLPAEFSSRRSTQQELAAEFVVNQSSRDLPGEFVSRQPGSQPLLAVMNIVHFLNLGAKFEIRHSTSENLQGAMTSRQADSQTLIAAFSVIPEASADLLGGFISRKTISSISGVVIAYNPRALFNLELDIGTGFTGGIKEGSDKVRKNIGEASMKVATRYEKDRNDYVTFGWKYRYVGEGSDQNFTATPGRNLNAGFTIPWQDFKELGASFEVGGPKVRTYVTILPYSYNPFITTVGTDWTTILESRFYGTSQMGDAWLLNWDAMLRAWTPGIYYSARITLQHDGEDKIVLGYETSTRPPTGWVWDGLAVGILPIALTRSYLIFFGYPTTPFTIRVEMKASSSAFDIIWQYLTGTYTYTR